MKNFKSKFSILCETAIQRFQANGFLPGDAVKLKKDYLKSPLIAGLSDQIKGLLVDIANSGSNLKISTIKSNVSDISQGSQTIGIPTQLWADVYIEYAPGMWKTPLTIPLDVLEQNLPENEASGFVKYDDRLKRQNPDSKDDHIGSVPDTKGQEDERKLTTSNTKLINSNEPSDGINQVKKPVETKKIKKESNSLADICGDIIFS